MTKKIYRNGKGGFMQGCIVVDHQFQAELIATVVHLVNSGQVTLCGTFKGARFDLTELATREYAA